MVNREKIVLKKFKHGKTEKDWTDNLRLFFLITVGGAEKYPTKSVTFHVFTAVVILLLMFQIVTPCDLVGRR